MCLDAQARRISVTANIRVHRPYSIYILHASAGNRVSHKHPTTTTTTYPSTSRCARAPYNNAIITHIHTHTHIQSIPISQRTSHVQKRNHIIPAPRMREHCVCAHDARVRISHRCVVCVTFCDLDLGHTRTRTGVRNARARTSAHQGSRAPSARLDVYVCVCVPYRCRELRISIRRRSARGERARCGFR